MIHLVITTDPLPLRGDLIDIGQGFIVANCGRTLRNPKLAYVWDETVIGERLNLLPIRGLCKRCVCAHVEDPGEPQRIYGLVEG